MTSTYKNLVFLFISELTGEGDTKCKDTTVAHMCRRQFDKRTRLERTETTDHFWSHKLRFYTFRLIVSTLYNYFDSLY